MKLIFTAFSLMIFISAANADNMALFEANKKSILTAFSIAGPQSKLSKSESKFAYKFKHTAERQVQGEKWVLRDLESKYRKCGSLEKMSPKDAVKYEELVRTSL